MDKEYICRKIYYCYRKTKNDKKKGKKRGVKRYSKKIMAFFLALALLLGAVPMEANVVLASETVSSVSENTLEEDTQGKEGQNQEDS